MEGARALNGLGAALLAEPVKVIVAADDQVTSRRMVAALARAAVRAPVEVGGGAEAVAASLPVDGGHPGIVTLACDASNPERMAELRRLRKLRRELRIVAVSPALDATGVRRALEAGADGVVFESELEVTLAPSVLAVAAGQAAVPRRVRGGLQKLAFSHRERQALAHVAAGLTNKQIADALFLSESTVKSHLSSAFVKLGVHSRKEAAALVLDPDQGLGADLLAAGVPALAGVRTQAAP